MSREMWQEVQVTEQQLTLRDPQGWFQALAHDDGCVDLYRYFETPQGQNPQNDEECCYLHVCDLDEMIERLEALRTRAIEHFNRHAMSEYWQKDEDA